MARWVVAPGMLDTPASEIPPEAQLAANAIATAQRRGYDLNFRVLREAGVDLTGHFEGVTNGRLLFAGDLAERVAWSDAALVGAVIYSTGQRPAFSDWLPWREAFDDQGFLSKSTVQARLYRATISWACICYATESPAYWLASGKMRLSLRMQRHIRPTTATLHVRAISRRKQWRTSCSALGANLPFAVKWANCGSKPKRTCSHS